MANQRTGQALVLRLAALEREAGGQWFELGFTDPSRRTLLMKILVEGTLIAPRRILKAIVQPAGQQPLLLPERLARRQLPTFRPARDPRAQRLGKVTVKVAAGSYLAEHFRVVEGGRRSDLWISSEVPGWPMVKLESGDLLLELMACGRSATSQVKGKPAQLDDRWLGGKAPPGTPDTKGGTSKSTSKSGTKDDPRRDRKPDCKGLPGADAKKGK